MGSSAPRAEGEEGIYIVRAARRERVGAGVVRATCRGRGGFILCTRLRGNVEIKSQKGEREL